MTDHFNCLIGTRPPVKTLRVYVYMFIASLSRPSSVAQNISKAISIHTLVRNTGVHQ